MHTLFSLNSLFVWTCIGTSWPALCLCLMWPDLNTHRTHMQTQIDGIHGWNIWEMGHARSNASNILFKYSYNNQRRKNWSSSIKSENWQMSIVPLTNETSPFVYVSRSLHIGSREPGLCTEYKQRNRLLRCPYNCFCHIYVQQAKWGLFIAFPDWFRLGLTLQACGWIQSLILH